MAVTLFCAGQFVPAADAGRFVPGVSSGLVYTPDSDFSGTGWTVSASVERPVSKVVEVRARAGIISLEADGDGRFGLGVHAGERMLLPYHHGGSGFTLDATIHHVFADGPGIRLAVSAGWVF